MHLEKTRNLTISSVCAVDSDRPVSNKKLLLFLLLFCLCRLCRLFLSDAEQIAQVAKIFLDDQAESLGVKT